MLEIIIIILICSSIILIGAGAYLFTNQPDILNNLGLEKDTTDKPTDTRNDPTLCN